MAGSQGKALGDSYWQQSLDEGYWAALLEQGEIVSPAALAADYQGPAEPATEVPPTGPAPVPDDGNAWSAARHAMEKGELFSLIISGANRGGLLVEWNGLPGFIPASHLRVMLHNMDRHERISELASRVGDSLTVRLIEVDPEQKRLVFSERAALTEMRTNSPILSRLCAGHVCHGVISSVTSFGAFVDLGGVEGLIHISEISWDRVGHPGDVLAPGQEVEVYVMGVKADQERIALSLKRLRPNPWSLAGANYQVGQILEGTVTNVVSFGAFVRIEEGLEGLIHVTELAEGNFLHPRNVVREGDTVKVRVLNIDAPNRRLGLSLRQAYSAELDV
ncbi:MAG: S1 RNA-binding domain-containing protein [Anaerolineae bacterium]|nr:S1 RNA-binding domain-containing protein [Anaerolineae bacterium]